MKISLTMPFIKSLKIEMKPVGVDQNGKVQFVPNPERKDYIVWDADQEAPSGFGVKVARKKTFIIRRKFEGKAISPTVGDVADYLGEKSPLTRARADASSLALKMKETRTNPNVEARKHSAAEMTVGEAMAAFRKHSATRKQNPASRASLKTYDTDIRKFEGFKWSNRKISEIGIDEIEMKFMQELKRAPEGTERAFSFLTRSVKWCIAYEALRAEQERRKPVLVTNPFTILRINGLYRTREQKEAHRQTNGSRNPLTPSDTLGTFLEACWSRRSYNDNETGVDFLITQLSLGCRKCEPASLQWGELLTDEQRLVTSHVMLDVQDATGPYVFFYKTKNRKSHKLPLGPMLVTLLRRRRDSCAYEAFQRDSTGMRRNFVFPARSKFSKTGHYSSPEVLLASLRNDADIDKLASHDLRRSFGGVMAKENVPEGICRRFLNHANPDVTSLYTASEWDYLRTWMEHIEQKIFETAPNVYNSLKPKHWAPIAAKDPLVCKIVKRMGRPRKVLPKDLTLLAA